MKIESEILLHDLIEKTRMNIEQAHLFRALSTEELNSRTEENSWSILKCFGHLNLYEDFYLPEIRKGIETSKTYSNKVFKSGIVGNYFAESMLSKEKLNKMKTFANMDLIGSYLERSILDRFISQQEQMLDLLDKAKKLILTKLNIPSASQNASS